MIMPDLDLLIYAYSKGREFYQGARDWWEALIDMVYCPANNGPLRPRNDRPGNP